MEDSDGLFREIGMHTAKEVFIPNAARKNDPIGNSDKLSMMLVGLFVFVGADIVKIVFRKNYGMTVDNVIRTILGFIFLLIMSGIMFSVSLDEKYSSDLDSDITFAFGILYIVFAGYVLREGLKQRARTNNKLVDEKSAGESYLLNFLVKDGWSEKKVYILAEPLCTLALGIFIAIFNLFAGLPLIACAISVWVHKVMLIIFSGMRDNKQRAMRLNETGNDNGSFNEIKVDF